MESNKDIVKQLIPQLIANKEEDSLALDTISKSRKRTKFADGASANPANFNSYLRSSEKDFKYETQSQGNGSKA